MLRNMKIRKKLVITFVLVSVLSSVAGIIGLFQIKSIDAAYSSALSKFGYAFSSALTSVGIRRKEPIDGTYPSPSKTKEPQLVPSRVLAEALLRSV